MEKSAVIKIILGLVVLGAIVVGIFYWQNFSEKAQDDYIPDLNIPGNPVEGKLPETNPIEKTNPFKSIYQNPFSQ